MSNDIKELIDRIKYYGTSYAIGDNLGREIGGTDDLLMAAASALENLDAQLEVCVKGDINKTRENEILLSALTKWGAGIQTVMVFEEMAELQKELCKSLRGKDNRGYIAEEIADVRIVLDQMVILYDCAEDVDTWRKVKLGRLEKRLSAQEGEKDELLAASAKPEPTEVLTLDELRKMDGEPVWIKSLTDQTERWGLVSLFRQATTGKLYVYIYDTGHGERNLSSQEYGMTWLAYRCKPKEEQYAND